jgi:hypothetical protein
MLSVAELLERAADCDWLAAQASPPNGKTGYENLAVFYRHLAEQAEKCMSADPTMLRAALAGQRRRAGPSGPR